LTLAQSQVTNLVDDLAAKASTSYVDSGLSAKSDTSHVHSVANVTGLQTALDGKAATSHTHVVGDITGLQTALDSKAPLAQTIVSTSATATITSSDSGKIYQLTGATGRTFTLNSGLPAGSRVDFVQDGAGQITFLAGSGVTLKSKGSKLKTAEQYSGATLLALSTSVYHIIGDLA
jgi:hypothetical protein